MPGLEILIAEDNGDLGYILKTQLRRLNRPVWVERTGQAVLERFREDTQYLLVLDLGLPDIPGKELVEILKGEVPQLEFMVMTGAGDQKTAVDMMKLGAREYLLKDQNFIERFRPAVSRVLDELSTEEKLRTAEEALRRSEERFQLAVEGANEGIFDWPDVQQDYVWWSPQVYRLLGFESGDVASSISSLRDLLHGEDRARLNQAMQDHLEARRPFEAEVRILTRDKGYRWFRIRGQGVWDADGRPARMAGSMEDITARIETQKQIRRNEELMRISEQLTQSGGWIVEMDPRRVQWSEETRRIHGVGPDYEPTLEKALDFFHPEDRKEVEEEIMEAIRQAKPFEIEARLISGDGVTKWVRAIGRPVVEQERLTRVIGAIQDITPRKEEENERHLLEQQLRQSQKLETMGTLAGGIAHDFNNILAAIYGYVALAEGKLQMEKADHPALEDLAEIMKAAERAKELVQQILTFSRKSDSVRKPLQLRKLVEDTCRLVRASLPTTVKIDTVFEIGDEHVDANATELEQVIINLCTNAYHATRNLPDKRLGHIRVELVREWVDGDQLKALHKIPSGEYCAIHISDNGMGISPIILDRIFEPFFTTKGVGEGTGMGLAVVHGIVQRHKGTITVESELERGSRFSVFLPVCREVAEDEAGEKVELPRGDARILVVDDEEAVALTTSFILKNLGYDVTTEFSAEKALRFLEQDPAAIDLVLSDQTMNDMTGVELARKIRQLRADMPILLMTGFSDALSPEIVEAEGLNGYLQKPFDMRTLGQALNRALAAAS